jgi:putative DNA modification/repair radical SAM protein
MTNECVYQCRYCINRASNDVLRATFTPEEVAKLTIEFYRRNYIEGLFLSSGIYPTPQASAERMLEAVRLLRNQYHFGGYIHIKSIPGADEATVCEIGWLADRMSVNLELPTAAGLETMAPNKSRKSILTPMKLIQSGIHHDKNILLLNDARNLKNKPEKQELFIPQGAGNILPAADNKWPVKQGNTFLRPKGAMKHFVPAGQSTQMIIGATMESDYQIMAVTENLYQKFDLKRVFYSSFVNVNHDSDVPQWQGRQLLDREHRLYQADFLLRFYQFHVEELLSPERPDFNMLVDPKCDYALRHLELFPVEINTASYSTLLKVPGVGVKSAQRIVKARRTCMLDFKDIQKIGVVMKRAVYFITCRGRMMYPIHMTEDNIVNYLIDDDRRKALAGDRISYKQLSLFDLTGDQTVKI